MWMVKNMPIYATLHNSQGNENDTDMKSDTTQVPG